MVILVSDENVEDRSAKLLLDVVSGQAEEPDRLDRLFVGIGSRRVEIIVAQSSERLHVELLTAGGAIEALRHEMRSAAFMVYAAFGHVDAGGAGQEKEAILNKTKALRIGQLLVTIVGDAVVTRKRATDCLRKVLATCACSAFGLPVG